MSVWRFLLDENIGSEMETYLEKEALLQGADELAERK